MPMPIKFIYPPPTTLSYITPVNTKASESSPSYNYIGTMESIHRFVKERADTSDKMERARLCIRVARLVLSSEHFSQLYGDKTAEDVANVMEPENKCTCSTQRLMVEGCKCGGK